MNFFSTYRKLLSYGVIALATVGWAACSSAETREAYDKFYGKGRSERDAQGIVEDSLRRIQAQSIRETLATEVETTTTMAAQPGPPPKEVAELLEKNTCSVCHKVDERLVGPPWVEIAQRNYPVEEIVALVHQPRPENWPGYPPMAPLTFVPEDEIIKIGNWINSLK